jgi:hypothetical protein
LASVLYAIKSNLKSQKLQLNHLTNNEKLISLLLVIGVIFLLFDFVMMCYILVNKTLKRNLFLRKQTIREQIHEVISEYLLMDNYEANSFFQNKNFAKILQQTNAKDRLFREVLYEEILHINKILSGNESNKLEHLLLVFGLEKTQKNNFQEQKWQEFVSLTNDLIALKNLKNLPIYDKLLNHENQFVRMAAVKAKISIDGNNSERISELKLPMTDYEIFEIINFLRNNQKHFSQVGNILSNPEPTITKLGIDLAKTFQLLALSVDFKALLTHKNLKIRLATIDFMIECGKDEFVDFLKNRYEIEEEAMKIAIINYIKHYGGDDEIPFLMEIISVSKPQLQILAAYALKNMNAKGYTFFNFLQEGYDLEKQKIAVHVNTNFS